MSGEGVRPRPHCIEMRTPIEFLRRASPCQRCASAGVLAQAGVSRGGGMAPSRHQYAVGLSGCRVKPPTMTNVEAKLLAVT